LEEDVLILEKMEKLLFSITQPITLIEIEFFFYFYVFHLFINKNANIASLLAFDEFLKEADVVSDESLIRLKSLIQMSKMMILVEQFEKTGELDRFCV
jgi:hypothetical protein